ncbi:enoyl-CoA hydratase/isomerase family protein [Nocardiopsis sp. FIRDI 009]|uniref:enoyl-CoA hydratase/isomerase family protein n=1 Tax=Nocardiopsis sp. FIRDI 009 TaxID=714197 RepID=UPI000E24DED7|nr:enoyl-CoA hydratase/isomerase family protein [Nocardiopsis sp. FIRDI 009]
MSETPGAAPASTGTAPPTPSDAEVVSRVEGALGRITLNRPRAINALNHAMVRDIEAVLTAWEGDDTVAAVLIDGAGERGLCAGGDIRSIQASARGDGREAAAFWRDEYLLNAHIARFTKPYVAFMDGVVMGGGVGVSAHGSVRVVTERSTVGMPEATIGFVPDVGGTFLLSRAPGETGTHMALTAGSVGPGDAVYTGLADHFVPSERLADLADALTKAASAEHVADAVGRFAETVPAGDLAGSRHWIDACYSADTAEEIVDRLRSHGDKDAARAADVIESKSPTSVKVALAALCRARELPTLEAVLEQEYRVSCATLSSPDLVEGVRAQVIDKDRNPRWAPDRLAEVSDSHVARFFAAAPDGPLGLIDEGSRA